MEKYGNIRYFREILREEPDILFVFGEERRKADFLHGIKLCVEKEEIEKYIRLHSPELPTDEKSFLKFYFGKDVPFACTDLPKEKIGNVFVIPSSRDILFSGGYFRSFSELVGYPFPERQFSHEMMLFMSQISDIGKEITKEVIFILDEFIPVVKKLFLGELRIVLRKGCREREFPLWTLGQRMFVPLFLSFLLLKRKRKWKTVVIEEPFVGLDRGKKEKLVRFLKESMKEGNFKLIVSLSCPSDAEYFGISEGIAFLNVWGEPL